MIADDPDVFVLDLNQDGLGDSLLGPSTPKPRRPRPEAPTAPTLRVEPGRSLRRAPRFNVRLPVRYRMPGEERWHLGVTENVSQTGILFRTELTNRRSDPQLGAPLDVVVEVLPRNPGGPGSQVHRRAAAVRVARPETSGLLPALAVRCATELWKDDESHATAARAASIGPMTEIDPEVLRHFSRVGGLDSTAFSDGFAWLISIPELAVELLPEPVTGVGIRRARRFATKIPVRYRLPNDTEWFDGITTNISHSGMLFQTRRAEADMVLTSSCVDDHLPLQVTLQVSGAIQNAPEAEVRCFDGRLIRTGTAHHTPTRMTSVAVTVQRYVIEVIPTTGDRRDP